MGEQPCILPVSIMVKEASGLKRDTRAWLKGHYLPCAGHDLILPGTRRTSVHVCIREMRDGEREGTVMGNSSQKGFLPAGCPPHSWREAAEYRGSSRAQSHTFASLSPSTLGTFRVSLCAASILFPSRKTTAPSSIPSCKKKQSKAP